MIQKILWMPVPTGNTTVTGQPGIITVDYMFCQRPFRLWTLYQHINLDQPPEIPYSPQHNVNSFLEEWSNDYNIRKNKLYFYSRVRRGGHWILLEFKEEPTCSE